MKKRIAIVGGGVIGLFSALQLLRRGHDVTLIERGNEAHDCCSLGNAGMLVPSHFIPFAAPGMVALGLKWMLNPRSPFYIRPRPSMGLIDWGLRFMKAATKEHVARSAPILRDLHLASRTLFEELAGETGNDFGLEKRGLISLCKTEHALEEEAHLAARAREYGIPAEVVSRERLSELEPDIELSVAGGVYFPLDCHIVPTRLMATLARLVRGAGGTFRWNAEVTGWRTGEGKLIAATTPHGDIEADEFVVAGGAFSSGIVRGLGLRLPMEAGKGYSLTHPRPRKLPRLPALLAEARVAVTPMGTSLRVGGTMEMSGLDPRIQSRRIQGIVEAFPAYYPQFSTEDFAGIVPWSGFRPCSPDGLPYVGRFGRFPNLCMATGHGMLGISLGPITGKLVAQIVSDEKPSLPVDALSPKRYE